MQAARQANENGRGFIVFVAIIVGMLGQSRFSSVALGLATLAE